MKAFNEIRKDLKEIRYYYTRQEVIDRMSFFVENDIIQSVKSYSDVMKKAPMLLYELYMSLYVLNNTQEALAADWDKSLMYIRKVHVKLLNYLQENLKS